MFRLRSLAIPLAAILSISLAHASFQTPVHVVDSTGSGNFTTIQTAISAAAPGDIILIRSGTYAGFTMQGKGVTLQGDTAPSRPVIQGSSVVDQIPIGQTAILAGFDLDGNLPSGAFVSSTLTLKDSTGAIRIQELNIQGKNSLSRHDVASRALIVSDAGNVALTSVIAHGGNGFSPTAFGAGEFAPAGFEAASVASSSISMHRCLFYGGYGGSWTNGGLGGGGGPALIVADCELVMVHNIMVGGDTGDSGDGITQICFDGPPAMWVSSPQPSLIHEKSTFFVGGQGGTDVWSNVTCPDGPGVAGVNPISWPGNPRVLLSPPLVRSGQALVTQAQGLPGDLILRMVSFDPIWQIQAGRFGVLLIEPRNQLFSQIMGVIPSGGILDIDETRHIPATWDGMTFHTQSVFRTTNGQIILGNTSTMTVVDASF